MKIYTIIIINMNITVNAQSLYNQVLSDSIPILSPFCKTCIFFSWSSLFLFLWWEIERDGE